MKRLCLLLICIVLLVGCGKGKQAAVSCDAGHADTNQDNMCDNCAQFMLVRLDIYAINDLHGKLEDTPYQPGVDELSAYLKQAQQAGNTLLLSTGDMWQGAAESNLTGGYTVTQWMNAMQFTAMTMGGHEFDWGEEQIRQNRELADFPFLAINIYDRQTNQRVDYCESSRVVDIEGVQIGIIGAIGNCYYSVAAENTANVYFQVGDDLTELVKAESQLLRSQGVDFIIYCLHDGAAETTNDTPSVAVSDETLKSYYDPVLSEGYVDLVLEADSHYWYNLIDGQGVYHLQAGGNNSGISHATVLINKANGSNQILTAELIGAGKYSHTEPDPVVSQLLDKYQAQIAPGYEILGNNGQYRNSSAICQLVANLYCDKGMEKWGADYPIVLGGGYMSCRFPSFLDAGSVTYGQLISLLPFDNKITLCSIQGSDLISRFLENDHYAYYIKITEYGKSVQETIDPNATYYVVTDSYSANYAPNHMTVIDIYDETTFARDLLAEYIAAGSLT